MNALNIRKFKGKKPKKNKIIPVRNLWKAPHRYMYTDTFIHEKKSTEHKDSILATHPELDGTGLEYWSYATLHFNSRTGQSVFMIRQ